MATFLYSGRRVDGSQAVGRHEALTRDEVAAMLLEQGVTPVSIEAVQPTAKSSSQTPLRDIKLFEKVTLDELIIFSRQIASLIRAGVPITKAIRGLANTIRNPLLSRSLHEIADELEKGNSLSTTLNKHPKVFNNLYVSIVHIGENTGRLDESFRQMSEHLELERQTIRSIKQATRYPSFVIIAIIAALGVINTLVIPAFKSVFDSFDAELPWQTRVLIGLSDFTLTWWPVILVLCAVLAFSFFSWKNTPNGRLVWDRWILHFPLIGNILYRAILGRFSRTFSVVLRAGIPIEHGLSIVSRALNNEFIGSHVAAMRRGIERGESFTTTAYRTEMFSPLVMQMLAVGEETGRVDEMLEEVANFYEEEVEYSLKNLSSAIEPILIIAIGAMVLVLAMGVFLPLWELNSTFNR